MSSGCISTRPISWSPCCTLSPPRTTSLFAALDAQSGNAYEFRHMECVESRRRREMSLFGWRVQPSRLASHGVRAAVGASSPSGAALPWRSHGSRTLGSLDLCRTSTPCAGG